MSNLNVARTLVPHVPEPEFRAPESFVMGLRRTSENHEPLSASKRDITFDGV